MTAESIFYFAYGSNLLSTRLLERVGDCRILGAAVLDAHTLSFRKQGRDGSGKCDVHPAGEAHSPVWGALYGMTDEQKSILDAIEGPGYSLAAIDVTTRGGGSFAAFTYRARDSAVAHGLAPFDWYLDFVVHGALEHDLPPDYVARVRTIPSIEDPDPERRAINRAILARGRDGSRKA